MLEILARANVSQDVHRLANLSYIAAFAEKKGLTIDEVTDVIRFSRDDVTRELMEGPFQPKLHLGGKFGDRTRFSDGEWPVFYAAVDRTTAGKEAAHHYGRRAAGDPASPRAVYYSIVRCRFSGEIIDLRPQFPAWPDLVSEDYTFCNALGHEAHAVDVGALLSPSARHDGGTTMPAFIEGTLSEPVIEAAARLSFDAGHVEIEVREPL
jgi:RES domain-containing protein